MRASKLQTLSLFISRLHSSSWFKGVYDGICMKRTLMIQTMSIYLEGTPRVCSGHAGVWCLWVCFTKPVSNTFSEFKEWLASWFES